MDIKSSINGVDVILEGELLDAYLLQKEKDLADDKVKADAEALALAEITAKRDEVLTRLGISAEEAKLLLA
jgi:hypothetical protein